MSGLADVARHAGIREPFAELLFESLLALLMDGEDHSVTIRSLGTWTLHKRKARTFTSSALPGGRVVKGESYTIKFTPSPKAKEAINGMSARAKSAPRPLYPNEQLTFQKRNRK